MMVDREVPNDEDLVDVAEDGCVLELVFDPVLVADFVEMAGTE